MLSLLTILGLIDIFILGVALFTPIVLTQFICVATMISLVIIVILVWMTGIDK